MTARPLVPWRPLVFDRYRVVDEYDQSVWEFERNPALERRQFVEFERLIRKLRYRVHRRCRRHVRGHAVARLVEPTVRR